MKAPGRLALTAWIGSTLVATLVGCGSDDSAPEAVQIRTLTNRADLVSDGDALVEIVLPGGAAASTLKVDVGGRDVTSAFTTSGGRTLGVVTGLARGANVVTASADGAAAATLTVTNAPRGGPILSGPQIVPYVCATVTPQAASASLPATNQSGLSTAASDAQCNIATEYKLYYKTTAANCSLALPDPSPTVPFASTSPPTTATPPTNPCFKPYNPAAAAPSDLATATTGAPYIVRVERGVINRGIYDIAVLYDPTKPWTATAPQAQWNGKLYYQFGASTGQPRRQARPSIAWSSGDTALTRGYMVAVNSMTDSSQNSNRPMMAETVMMMKEHIGDAYGPIRFTMGTGCSGGSINSNMNASIAPGQLDGIVTSCTFPDSETTGIEVQDCTLLVEAYQKPAWLNLMASSAQTQAQINAKAAAINGHPDQTGCYGWYNSFGTNAKAGNFFSRTVTNFQTGAITQGTTLTNNCQLPTGVVYDPTSNPNGARCNTWSWQESVYGKAAGSVQANDPRDNVGVQYGLKALQAGTITPEEFVTINEIVGGFDRDSALRAARTVADTAALTVSYRAGIVMDARNHAKTAAIDLRGWDDSALLIPPGNTTATTIPIHYVWRSFSIRDRLVRDAGDYGNQAMWRFGRFGLTPTAAVSLEAFTTMDQWLTTLKADTSSATLAQKVRAARPAASADFCYLSSDAAQSTKVTDFARCDADTFLKPSSSPRQVAGGARTEDALKCQLKPLVLSDYAPIAFTAAQQARLQAVFPGGVCDWTKPGVEQQPAVGPLTFAAGPAGQPLPPEPVSGRK